MKTAAFDELKARASDVPIEDVIAQRGIELKGNSKSRCGPCPVCGGTDRFWINTAKQKQMWGCRKCSTGGDVIALVEHLDGVDFKTAVETLTNGKITRRGPAAVKPTSTGRDENSEYAIHIWSNTRAATDTILPTYLASRAITIPPPAAVRFHPRLQHRPSGTAWPAMVALVTRGTDGKPVAIHRTFLKPDGSGKAAVKEPKLMLGPCGGGAVRLADADDFVMIGEGIETCLAAMQATGLPAWSALSAPGLKSLNLPDAIRRVTILADADDDGSGEAAAVDAGRRWKKEGRAVRIARPPVGKDFNDLLLEEEAAS